MALNVYGVKNGWKLHDYPKGNKRVSNGKQSFYENIGGNKMIITYESVIKALKETKNKWEAIDMTKAIIRSFLVLAVIFAGVACGDSKDLSQSQTQDSQECNFTRESVLYSEWAKDWKGQEDDVYYYNSGTPYAIINMLKQCDIKGLRLMLDELGKREFISMQASGGMIF